MIKTRNNLAQRSAYFDHDEIGRLKKYGVLKLTTNAKNTRKVPS
jgi:hypothetical protein